MNIKILIIDDDIDLCRLIKKYLDLENYITVACHDGMSGLIEALNNEYHLIILDVMLPELSGFDVLMKIRQKSVVPVLMLSARDNEVDKVSGLRIGADDYITKPFSNSELVARVQSILRRTLIFNNADEPKDIELENGEIKISYQNREVHIRKQKVVLTAKEFDLLYFLVSNKGKVYTKKQIYCAVWEDEYAFDDNNIMVHIQRLRKKIEEDVKNPKYIITVWGVGYKFREDC